MEHIELTHQVDYKLLRLEVFLHLRPHTIQLELFNPLPLLLSQLVVKHSLSNLLLRQLIPLKLLHLRTWRDRYVLTGG